VRYNVGYVSTYEGFSDDMELRIVIAINPINSLVIHGHAYMSYLLIFSYIAIKYNFVPIRMTAW
jgi:hypothetical protein